MLSMREQAAMINKQMFETQELIERTRRTTIDFAKLYICKCKDELLDNPLYCLQCTQDCAFAGDCSFESVLHNAEKVCKAIEYEVI